MNLDLPLPVAAFIGAMQRRDATALLAQFTPEAVVKDLDRPQGDQSIRDWDSHDFICAAIGVHLINGTCKGAQFVLTALTRGERSRPPVGVARQFDWSFTIISDLITELVIAPATMPALLPAVAAFVNATNDGDLDSLVATFAADALVNDQLNEHWGRAAIRTWAESEMIAHQVTIVIVRAVEHYGHSIITANIDGDYDKRGMPEPLVLTFYFSLQDEKIVQLIVLRNLPNL